jgi:hypothetical protein
VGHSGPFIDVLDALNQPVEYLRNTNAGHTVQLPTVALPPEALEQEYVQVAWRYYLVSGSSGARAQLRLDDLQVARQVPFVGTYPSMFLRGTFNNWSGDAPMTRVADYVWQTDAVFTGETGSYKFEMLGNQPWSPVNFGDYELDGIGDLEGSNIPISEGAGTYRMLFNDQTRAYRAYKVTAFNLWRFNQFSVPDLMSEPVSGPFADPGITGAQNLYRFATGLGRDDDPVHTLPQAGISPANQVLFIYRRLLDPHAGVAYTVELSTDVAGDASWREVSLEDGLAEWTVEPTGDEVTEDVTLAIPDALIDNTLHLRLKISPED